MSEQVSASASGRTGAATSVRVNERADGRPKRFPSSTRSAASRKAKRLLALGRAEMLLLVRNRAALTTALVIPLGSLWLLNSVTPTLHGQGSKGDAAAGPVLISGTVGMVLLFVVYSTLVSSYVARRESLVLKRLRTGELQDAEILMAMAFPTTLLAIAQVVIVTVVGTAVMGVRAPADPVLLGLGVLLGIPLTVALAACSSVFTRTVEMAQLSTMPLILISVAGAGLIMPLSELPAWAADACRLLPLSPVMEVVRIGWLGSADGVPATAARGGDGWATALPFAGGALVWVLITLAAVRRWFRWEPRR